MRPNSQRAKYAEIFIWIVTAWNVVSIISTFFQYLLLQNLQNGIAVSPETATSNDTRQSLILIVNAAIFIVAAVMFIQWFRRAYYNQEVRFGNMNSSNGWASGGWFIPIYCFFKPIQLMREIYIKAEATGIQTDKKINRLTIVGWWWGLWVLINISSNAISRFEGTVTTLSGLIGITIASMAIDIFYIPLGILAVKTIRNYNEMELVLIETSGENLAPKNGDLLDSF